MSEQTLFNSGDGADCFEAFTVPDFQKSLDFISSTALQ